jgi:hypothetical protein
MIKKEIPVPKKEIPMTFAERAAKLGLGNPNMSPGEMIDALLTVDSIDHLKDIFDQGGSVDARNTHVQALFAGVAQGRDAESALLRSVHQYVFGNAELSDEDRATVAPAFPLTVRAITASDKVVDGQWDLGISGTPVVLNIGTLTINQGGFITIENTALSLTVDNLVRNGNTGNAAGDFNIFGNPGTAAGPGASPSPPGQAQNGAPGTCSSGGVAAGGGGNGSTGATGTVGGVGGTGGTGLPSLPAIITITSSISGTASQITIHTASGAGGAGGPGGTGAAGGQGGNGGDGVTCACTGNSGGTGGQGGTGGAGGQGGPGGNAVDAAGNVTVSVPAQFAGMIVPISLVVQPGAGGAGGAGGPGGAGGGGSSGGKHNDGGSGGSVGAPGASGSAGQAGTQIGKPATIIVQPT